MQRSHLRALMLGALEHLLSTTAMWGIAMLMTILSTLGLYLELTKEEITVLPQSMMAVATGVKEGQPELAPDVMVELEKLQKEVDSILTAMPKELDVPTPEEIKEEILDRREDPFAGIVLPDEAAFLELSAIEVMPLVGPKYLTQPLDPIQTEERLYWQSIGQETSPAETEDALAFDKEKEALDG